MKLLFILVQYLVPQHLFSRVAGLFADCRWAPLKNLMIRVFIGSYGVNMAEAVQSDYRAYACFNDFFTRALRPGARPLAENADGRALLSPADGTVSAIGEIREGRVFQAKGHDFSLLELLGGDEAMAAPFAGGNFATVYLSPKDYHRVHMPCGGILRETVFIPGRLFSVNQVTAEHIPGLFSRNERLVCLFDTAIGPMAVILVGAMIVGSVETVWGGTAKREQGRAPVARRYGGGNPAPESMDPPQAVPAPPLFLEKGQEMGRFKLGSTVILLFGPHAVEWSARLGAGSTICMGQQLGVTGRGH